MMGRHFGLALPRFGIDLVGLKSACEIAPSGSSTMVRTYGGFPKIQSLRERASVSPRSYEHTS
jgi:hypothetical protein